MPPWKAKPRHIKNKFDSYFFKPKGIPMSMLNILVLAHEELEALRLMDVEHLNQEEASSSMNISRRTFQRILEGAREKVALTLINGNAIEIRGGNYTTASGRNASNSKK